MSKKGLNGILEDSNITISQIHWMDSLKKELTLNRRIDVVEKVKEFET